jgi:hypothetical protein
MGEHDPKAGLKQYLQSGRETPLWKVDGLDGQVGPLAGSPNMALADAAGWAAEAAAGG